MKQGFAGSVRKFLSREDTVVATWHGLSGQLAIPCDTHYVSLCGLLADGSRHTAPMCEPLHLWNAGLIETEQFYGIEQDRIIHRENLVAVEQDFPLTERPHLIGGHLTNILSQGIKKGAIKPAIVNLDTMLGPRRALRLLTETLASMSMVQGLSMVVWNVVLEATCKCRKDRRPELATALQEPRLLSIITEYGWRKYNGWSQGNLYEYGGSGKNSRTTMGTTVYWRKT